MPIPAARGHMRSIDPKSPRAGGMCQRCGERYTRSDIVLQHEYAGQTLINTGLWVCPVCLDEPQPQLLSPHLPPDPPPVPYALPEPYATEEGGPPGPAEPQINPFTEETGMPFE